MINQESTPKSASAGRPWRFFGGAVVGAVFGALLTFIISATAQSGAMMSTMGGIGDRFGGGHKEMLFDFVLTKIDASDTQREEIKSIVQAVKTDLRAGREDHLLLKAELTEVLTQFQVDRAALNDVRNRMLGSADLASERVLLAVGDVSDVLTQEQRIALVELHQGFRH